MAETSRRVQRLLLLASITLSSLVNAHTAVLFGASGTVGQEVLRALLEQPFWDKVILVGRRFPQYKDNEEVKVVTIQVSSLAKIDEMETEILPEGEKADACFTTVGLGNPQEVDLPYWHSVDVEMTAAIARFCQKMDVRYMALLSAVDADENAKPFSEEELSGGVNDAENLNQLGWLKMIAVYARMKGLAENAMTDNANSTTIIHVSLFQPNSIITETTRYGWVDWIIFRIHWVLDPWIPARYHSVPVILLGAAMARDAVDVLQHERRGQESGAPNVTRRTYDDYLRLAGTEYEKQKLSSKGGMEDL